MKPIKWYSESTTDMSEMMGTIGNLAHLGLFDQIDCIITTMPMDATPEMLIGVLRISSTMKGVLPSWKSMVILAHHELKNRGEDADAIMMGLIDK